VNVAFGLTNVRDSWPSDLRETEGIDVEPNPPVAGQGAVVTVPSAGEWHVYVTDRNGNVTELGPVQADANGQLDVAIPASAEDGTLTVTDEREPIPTDASFSIVSTQ
jgi:hypothetical protein